MAEKFENSLRATFNHLQKLNTRLHMERSKPTVWSAKQIEDLRDIYFAIANLHDAMAHLANDE
jgi:hypothetical protein